MKTYAKQNDIILTKEHIYIDEGISGRTAEKRPEFMHMIAIAKTNPKPFDVILVHKFDRFARSREDSVVYKSLLKKEADIRVISITESIEDDKFSVILEAMLEAMAEYYSLNLSDEVKKGMTEKAERGEFQTSPSYGYKVENGRLVVEDNEAQIIKIVFDKFASREMTMRQIAVWVNTLGVKTKRNHEFESRTIDYILNNPIYIGKVRWTPTGKSKRNFNHPDTILRDSSHETIIDLDTWNKTQERIKENKEIFAKHEKTTSEKKSWLCGLLRCMECNRTLVIGGKGYFVCNGYVKGQCNTSNHTKTAILEAVVLEEIRKTFDGELELKIVPKHSDALSQKEHEFLQESLNKLDLKEIRIKEAYQDGIDTLEEYKFNKNKLSEERQSLIRELSELKNRLAQGNDIDEDVFERIKNVFDVLSDPLLDMEIKYKTAHLLISKILYSKKEKILKLEYK